MEREQLITDAAKRGAAYLRRIRQRSIAPSDAAVAGLQRFHEPLPADPSDPAPSYSNSMNAVRPQP